MKIGAFKRRPRAPERLPEIKRRGRRDLRTLLAAGGGLLILLVLASATLDMLRTRAQTLRHAERQLMNLAGALAGETAGALTGVEVALTAAADVAGQAPPAVIRAQLRDEITRLPQVRSAAMFDASGRLLYMASDDGAVVWPANASDRAYFASQQRKPAASLLVGVPQEGSLIVSRSMLSPSGGAFAGVIAAALDLQQFERFYRAVQLGDGGNVSLLRADGTLLARYPQAPASADKAHVLPAELPKVLDGAASTLERRYPVDGELQLVALKRVSAFPLVVAVGVNKRAALEPWVEQAWHATARTILLFLVIVALILVLRRELGRREESEARLRESEERYALAMAGSTEGHWDWNLTEDRIYVSARLQKLLGAGDSDVVASSKDCLARLRIHPDDGERVRTVLAAHLAGKTPFFECECRVQDASGAYRWLQVRGLALRDSAGRPCRMSGSVADISEHKAAEEERAKLEARLRQAQRLEAVGTMAGGIAHDFNNILGAILGYGDMAHHAAPEGSALKRHVGHVMSAANRAKSLVDQILSYSRSQRGKRVPVCVASVLEETLELVRASLPHGVAVELINAAGNASVICDPTHVHQLAMNLCTNAVQAMPHGGRVTVALTFTDVQGERALFAGTLSAGPHVRLSVHDTGCGMTPEVLARIFEPFFTTKEAGSGTGLGLALVHDIVTELGGGLHVMSTPGHGSRFEIYLPCADAAVVQPLRQQPPIPRGAGQRLLLVEDEKPLMLLEEELLAALGYEPSGFASSSEALDALEADPLQFDAVITDQVMPDMSGTQLARRLRTLRADLPVILVSGYRGPLLEQEALAAGIDAVLTKPLEPRELAGALARVLRCFSL